MRGIKFRAWHLDGSGVHTMHEWSQVKSSFAQYLLDSKVMQFTGLKDKNGVEVYAGDLIRHPEGFHLEVKYMPPYWRVFAVAGGYGSEIIESGLNLDVIGNIHENPELLIDPTSV